MSDKKQKPVDNTPDRTANGTSILLRLPCNMASELRRIAKKEERSITIVAIRALRGYFKSEHNIEIPTETEE